MPDQRPTLEYARPQAKKRRELPWYIDVPLLWVTAFVAFIGLVFLAAVVAPAVVEMFHR